VGRARALRSRVPPQDSGGTVISAVSPPYPQKPAPPGPPGPADAKSRFLMRFLARRPAPVSPKTGAGDRGQERAA
jgi:hypothetical protein